MPPFRVEKGYRLHEDFKIACYARIMKSIRNICSTLVLAAALAGCSPDPETSFADGRAAFAANDFRGARVALIAGLREQPGELAMRLLLARTQIALGDGDGAGATLDELPAEVLRGAEATVLRAEAQVLRGRYDEALTLVETQQTGAADRVRALAHIGRREFAEAARAFEAGAGRDDVHPPLLSAYARFELARGAVEHAQELIDAALAADGKLVEGFLVRGEILAAINKLPEALDAYDGALGLHAANFDALLGKADVLARLGRFDEAEKIADALGNDSPRALKVAAVRARVAAGKGDWTQVRTILQPLENELRDSPLAVARYGEALLELDRPSLALSWLEPAQVRQSGSRELRTLVARARLADGNAAGALEMIRPVATRPDANKNELDIAAAAARAAGSGSAAEFARRAQRPSPQWLGGALAKADSALRNSQWREAETQYQAILDRTESSNAMVLNNLSYVKTQLGQDDEALKLALEAVKLEPDHPSILDTAGWLLVQSGSRQRGTEMLRRAARLDPDNTAIARHLSEATAD